MKALILRSAAIALCATLLGGSIKTSTAEPKGGDRIGDWKFQCEALSVNQNVCALTQTLVNLETKKRILTLVLRKVGRDKKLALFATVPLGIFLATGIAGKVDSGKQFNFIWQRCTTQGCQAAAVVDAELERAFKAGNRLVIGFKAQPNAKTIALGASLKGVTQGLKALNKE